MNKQMERKIGQDRIAENVIRSCPIFRSIGLYQRNQKRKGTEG